MEAVADDLLAEDHRRVDEPHHPARSVRAVAVRKDLVHLREVEVPARTLPALRGRLLGDVLDQPHAVLVVRRGEGEGLVAIEALTRVEDGLQLVPRRGVEALAEFVLPPFMRVVVVGDDVGGDVVGDGTGHRPLPRVGAGPSVARAIFEAVGLEQLPVLHGDPPRQNSFREFGGVAWAHVVEAGGFYGLPPGDRVAVATASRHELLRLDLDGVDGVEVALGPHEASVPSAFEALLDVFISRAGLAVPELPLRPQVAGVDLRQPAVPVGQLDGERDLRDVDGGVDVDDLRDRPRALALREQRVDGGLLVVADGDETRAGRPGLHALALELPAGLVRRVPRPPEPAGDLIGAGEAADVARDLAALPGGEAVVLSALDDRLGGEKRV